MMSIKFFAPGFSTIFAIVASHSCTTALYEARSVATLAGLSFQNRCLVFCFYHLTLQKNLAMAPLMITCPSCSSQFEPGNAFMKDFETQARQKMAAEWQKLKGEVDKDRQALQQQKELLEKQIQTQEQEIEKRLEAERQKMQQQLQETIRKSIATDFENQMKM